MLDKKNLINAIKTLKSDTLSPTHDDMLDYQDALDIVIKSVERLVEAEGVLPEKKYPCDGNGKEDSINFGINFTIDACLSAIVLNYVKKEEFEQVKTVLRAWQDVFGTTQLTHAEDRLHEAEKRAQNLKNLKEK